MSRRLAALVGTGLALALTGCPEAPRRAPDAGAPTTLLLRYRFEKGKALVYDATTTEEGLFDVTIHLRSRWVVESVDAASGGATLAVTIERYRQSIYPPRDLPEDALALNKGLAGARFRLEVSNDGRRVTHLGADRLPEVSEASVEAVRSTLGSHVLKLPAKAVQAGQRWTIDTPAAADAGPGAIATRSLWRVLSLRRAGERTPVELVCLSTMTAEPSSYRGGTVTSTTEFHYQYLFDAAAGVLERLTSTGATLVEARGVPDGGSGTSRTGFEARVTLHRGG